MDRVNVYATQMAKAYDPAFVEPRWLRHWHQIGAFRAKVQAGKRSVFIPCPPPNVTGALHIGHAVNATIQDVFARAKRMQGYVVLWQPGTDHAGISTQLVVERKLYEETGKTRHEVGRDAFMHAVWSWKETYGNTIAEQFRRLGSSLDFDRWRFTLDEPYCRSVRTAFVRLFEKGLIYRGKRIINWCPRCLTCLSDLEVKHQTTAGTLYRVRYLGEQGGGGLAIATVRPETILADVAVAVHPEDPRYQALVGKNVWIPLSGRAVPVIADAYVDRDFGTGALKITPGHDPHDFEIGLRHHLPLIDILTPDGHMSAAAGKEWVGLDRFEARQKAVLALKEAGRLEGEEAYCHQVGLCDRCETVVEPRCSEQWFVKTKELAAPAIAVAEDGQVVFHPKRWREPYLEWLRNVRDWNISRQLWWGHRIPVWTCQSGHVSACVDDLASCVTCGGPVVQDPDVLDTWFSSALWPFAALGWPDQTPEFEYFYPAQVLSTARDILYLWVARMCYTSLEFLGKVPFQNVVVHATILARDGARMSKSKGTGVDPIEIMDRFGTDACRFWMAGAGTCGQDVSFAPEKIESARNFCNKIWNAARFGLINLEGSQIGSCEDLEFAEKLEDRWILSRLGETVEIVTRSIDDFALIKGTDAIYDFIWGEFCDWWLEIAKTRLREKDIQAQVTIRALLATIVKILHPFMPFLSEEIYFELARRELVAPLETLLAGDWPTPCRRDVVAEEQMGLLTGSVRAVRRILVDLGIPATTRPPKLIVEGPEAILTLFRTEGRTLRLSRALEYEFNAVGIDVLQAATAVVGPVKILLPLEGLIDLGKERSRLAREIELASGELARLDKQLANQGFVSKAPQPVVDKLRGRRDEVAAQKGALEERLLQY